MHLKLGLGCGFSVVSMSSQPLPIKPVGKTFLEALISRPREGMLETIESLKVVATQLDNRRVRLYQKQTQCSQG